MDAVKAFTIELYSIMDMKPPISKAKMTAITRNAIKAIKLYKHVVQCVEKFIQKCKPEYKIPGLYVIDSIVRQSRHQFGNDKDVFAPRFARNLKITFSHLFACAEEDKSKVIRVLNLWQKNAVFTTDVIQPIFDLAANPEFEDHTQINPLSSIENSPKLSVKTDIFKSQEITPIKDDPSKSFDSLQNSDDNKQLDPAILQHLQAIQSILKKQPGQSTSSPQIKKSETVKLFDKKLLDYDYGEEEDDTLNQSPQFQQQQLQHQNTSIEGLDSLLNNPEVLRTLRNVEGLMSTQSKQQAELDKIKEMRKEAEFDKHLAQTVQSLPFASECELKPSPVIPQSISMVTNPYTNQQYNTQIFQQQQQPLLTSDAHHKPVQQLMNYEGSNQTKPEVIDLDHIASPPHSKRDTRRDGYSTSSSRKRSPRKSSRDRQREREKERERDRERRKKHLPPFKRNHLAVVSTTLWVGHLSKLVHQDDLYGLFQPIGDIVSLNLISPRGCAFLCMNRRQDAARIMNKFQGERLQGRPMTIAWAPGQAMKDKEWKDYWEIEDGVSYIPWEKLNKDIDYDELEVGGMLDEETMPDWLKIHLKNLRATKKYEKKEDKQIDGSLQTSSTSNVIDQQGGQSSPGVQMQMSPAQNTQSNQINFNIPPSMNMSNPFGINPRLINPMMNPMMPNSMTPLSMGHPSMMMMNRMPNPFGPPPNMTMISNPQQMGISNDGQKSLGVPPPDMVMPFPFNMNLPTQAAISSAQSIMGVTPSPITTSGTNQLDPSTIMQFNLPPPPTLPNLSDFRLNEHNSSMSNEKYDSSTTQEETSSNNRNLEIDNNHIHDNRERGDRFNERDNKNDRGRRIDDNRQDPRNRNNKGGTEQKERKSSRWGDREESNNQNPNEGLGMIPPQNIVSIDNINDMIIQQTNPLHQILKHVIQDNIGNPGFQPEIFGPNGPISNQMFNMPPQSFSQGLGQDGPRLPLLDAGNMRGRGTWNRGNRRGFRGPGSFNNNSGGPVWDSNNETNWENNAGPNWDNNGPPVWQNQQNIHRGGMMGRGNIRPPLIGNISRGRGRDVWLDNNLSGGRGNREVDNWSGRNTRDSDRWGHGSRDSDGWTGRGNRPSSWRAANAGRRRNDDREGLPNQKRWRRDENPDWDEQKPWKRGSNEENDWSNNKQGPPWSNKKDEGNHSKYKNRENNDERANRRPSKWSDKVIDNNIKEDGLISTDNTEVKENVIQENLPTSNSMDIDNNEEENSNNLEQLPDNQKIQVFNKSEIRSENFNEENHDSSEFNKKVCDNDPDYIEQYSTENNDLKQSESQLNNFRNNYEESDSSCKNQLINNSNADQYNIENQNYQRSQFELENNDTSKNEINTQCEIESSNSYKKNYASNDLESLNQQHESIDTVPHFNENEVEENARESQSNFFFGSDVQPSIDETIESKSTELSIAESIISQNSDVLNTNMLDTNDL
ncbi:SR-related and CTD-associated factor 4-like isoform X2 [Daktulosphaira vitifoliae]|uniref:SR-related and CTD-associated factor 4-like isoform X2 n=1 Tax=Daktulosphaira vitifoliae TaxID=58002 RepID=UPI0021AA94D0|nr:SR-related and CTD-associated factor 4-like isoform X2 [Daktulosphaira vitifoliae]